MLASKYENELTILDSDEEKIILFKNSGGWFKINKVNLDSVLLKMKNSNYRQSLENLTAKPEALNSGHIYSHPILRLTNRCNLRCTHCYQDIGSSLKKNVKDLSLDRAKNFMDHIASQIDPTTGDRFLRTVQLFGGEPLLHPQFTDFVDLSLSYNLAKIRVSTNGTLFISKKEKLADYFNEKNKIEWRISIESFEKEKHEVLRPRSFDSIIKNMEWVIAKEANLTVKMVLTDSNVDLLESTLDTLYSMGVKHFTYRVLFKQGAASKNELFRSFDDFIVSKKLFHIIQKKPHLGPMLRPSPFGRWMRTLFMRDVEVYPQIYFYVDSDGKIYPNDKLCEKPEWIVGDINTGNFGDDKIIGLQKSIELGLPLCKSCSFEKHCFRGNFGVLYEQDPTLLNEFYECEPTRKSLKYFMDNAKEASLIAGLIHC